MSARIFLTTSIAAGAMLAATSVNAQTVQPGAGPVVYQDAPMVQPLPERMAPMTAGTDYETEYRRRQPVYAAPQNVPTAQHHQAPYPGGPVGIPIGQHAAVPPQYGVAYPVQVPPQFDRAAWLAECRAQYGDKRGQKGGILGSLLGAIAGGVIGNRVYDSERLAGSLIGAGVGGLAGLAIGTAIGSSKNRRARDECEGTLNQYLAGGYGNYGGGYYQQQYTLVPVTVAIPQRAVIREYVTYETVLEPGVEVIEEVRSEPVYIKPRPTKRTRYIKGQ